MRPPNCAAPILCCRRPFLTSEFYSFLLQRHWKIKEITVVATPTWVNSVWGAALRDERIAVLTGSAWDSFKGSVLQEISWVDWWEGSAAFAGGEEDFVQAVEERAARTLWFVIGDEGNGEASLQMVRGIVGEKGWLIQGLRRWYTCSKAWGYCCVTILCVWSGISTLQLRSHRVQWQAIVQWACWLC